MSEDTGRRARPKSFGEFLFDEIRSAFQDIRQKVVEEGWFGRVVTPEPVTDIGLEHSDLYGHSAEPERGEVPESPDDKGKLEESFREIWGPVERTDATHDLEHGHDLGIDL